MMSCLCCVASLLRADQENAVLSGSAPDLALVSLIEKTDGEMWYLETKSGETYYSQLKLKEGGVEVVTRENVSKKKQYVWKVIPWPDISEMHLVVSETRTHKVLIYAVALPLTVVALFFTKMWL